MGTRSMKLPPQSHTALHATLAMGGCQVALGISTLLMYVPVSLGAAHQAGALTLMSITIGLLHSLRLHSISAVAPFAPPIMAAAAVAVAANEASSTLSPS